MHNEARRFIMFVDQLYERQTRFMCTAASEPLSLFTEMKNTSTKDTYEHRRPGPLPPPVEDVADQQTTEGNEDDEKDPFGRDLVANMVRVEELASVKELSFAYQRAASRLIEMQSLEYEEKHTRDVRVWKRFTMMYTRVQVVHTCTSVVPYRVTRGGIHTDVWMCRVVVWVSV